MSERFTHQSSESLDTAHECSTHCVRRTFPGSSKLRKSCSSLTPAPCSSSTSSLFLQPSFARSRPNSKQRLLISIRLSRQCYAHTGVHDEIMMNFNGRWPRSSPHGKNPGSSLRPMPKSTPRPEPTANRCPTFRPNGSRFSRRSKTGMVSESQSTTFQLSVTSKLSKRKINEGRLRAETLAQVISLEEEEAQERSIPEHPKQLHLTLEANLTLQTRRRYISSMPKTVEQQRTKYQVLSNMWLLAILRQPGRALCRDLDERTWPLFLDGLLNRKNFAFQRQLENSEVMVGPDWNHCLEYEFQLCKDALRRAFPSVQHFGQRTTVRCIAWNVGSLFSQWPMQGQKRQTCQEHSLGEQSQLVGEAAGFPEEQQVEISSQTVGPH